MVTLLKTMLARIRASTWASFLVRGASIACGLLVLAWIGKSMNARAIERAPPAAEILDAAPSVTATTADATPPPPVVAAATAPPPLHGEARGRATPDSPVFLNEADVDELRRLPGVGAKRAEAIVAHRRHLGRFTRVEDLLRVKGVGRGTVKKWRPLVRLDARPVVDAGTSPSG